MCLFIVFNGGKCEAICRHRLSSTIPAVSCLVFDSFKILLDLQGTFHMTLA